MKYLFLLLPLYLILIGCESFNGSKPNNEGPTNLVTVNKSPVAADQKLTGRKFYIDETNARQALSDESVRRVRDIVRQMVDQGFDEVSNRRKGYVMVSLFSGQVSLIPEEDRKLIKSETGINPSNTTQYTVHETRYEKGKKVLDQTTTGDKVASFNITVYVNEYGKRPVRISSIDFKPPSAVWNGYEDQLIAGVEKDFGTLIIKAPETNLKMKGDPGCFPRFGFEQHDNKVIKVLKGSPAQAAGVKIDDIILSIDSEVPSDSKEITEVYEKHVRVPLKLKRGDKIIRTEIQAKTMCD